MGVTPFASHFPVTHSHLDKFFGWRPHEEYSKNTLRGRQSCCKLAFKKIAYFPLSLPLLTTYALGMAIIKIAELVGRIFTLVSSKRNFRQKFIETGKQATDFLMATCILPIKLVAEIIKLMSAAIFDARFYYASPRLYPFPVQLAYYKKRLNSDFYKFRIASGMTLQLKAEAYEIEQNYDKVLGALVKDETKIKFIRRVSYHLRAIKIKNLKSHSLDRIRHSIERFSKREGLSIEFIIHQQTIDDVRQRRRSAEVQASTPKRSSSHKNSVKTSGVRQKGSRKSRAH